DRAGRDGRGGGGARELRARGGRDEGAIERRRGAGVRAGAATGTAAAAAARARLLQLPTLSAAARMARAVDPAEPRSRLLQPARCAQSGLLQRAPRLPLVQRLEWPLQP